MEVFHPGNWNRRSPPTAQCHFERPRQATQSCSPMQHLPAPAQCQRTRRCQLAIRLAAFTALSSSSAFGPTTQGAGGNKAFGRVVSTLNLRPNINEVVIQRRGTELNQRNSEPFSARPETLPLQTLSASFRSLGG